jgi:formylglycine-generating enzyme
MNQMKLLNISLLLVLAWPMAEIQAATSPDFVDADLWTQSPGVKLPRLTIQSDTGISNQVLYSDSLTSTNWTVLINLLVTASPYTVLDPQAASLSRRFYRVKSLAPQAPPGMVYIPGGTFVMGNPVDNAHTDELPCHNVSISACYMDANLVTQALWDEVYQWAILNDYQFDTTGSGKDANYPAGEMTWLDAVKWCNARSEKEHRQPAYYTDSYQTNALRSGILPPDSASVNWNAGYRLPTEAEWERAARGGAAGHNYPWQDTESFSDSRANVVGNPVFGSGPYPHTSPVGYFPSNAYGLYDMAGNVWGWCWGWYDSTWYMNPDAGLTDTRGPADGSYRVLRGGSWNDDYTFARCAARGFDSPSSYFNFYGFRCVRGVSGAQ